MLWLYIIIFAYLLFALANIGDKLVVSKYKTEPIAYAFYVGVLGITSVILIPLGVHWLKAELYLLSFLAGTAFILAAYFMYCALSLGEASRAITLMGSSSPIFTFLLSLIFLQEKLLPNQLYAFIILVLAILIISWEEKPIGKSKFNSKLIIFALLAGLLFSANYVLTRYLFGLETYFTIFFWTRIGGVLTAIIIYLFPKLRTLIIADWKKPKQKKGKLVLAIQITGGAGVMAQSYALKLASATLVNALQAIQYASVFILASFLGKKYPALKEHVSRRQIIRKIFAIMLVAVGLFLITLK
jgi:drug/metabolite transporter (DMT)-like permease